MSRQQAKAVGKPRYYTGKPCRYGHDCERLTANGNCLRCHSRHQKKNPAAKVRATRKWQKLNFEAYREAQRTYRQTNSARLCAKNAKRRADKLRATPAWADLDAIREVYERCPPGLVVDHIHPLKGKLICGLHVEGNLQYLTPTANAIKGNSFKPDNS